jgi:hypothetical protein
LIEVMAWDRPGEQHGSCGSTSLADFLSGAGDKRPAIMVDEALTQNSAAFPNTVLSAFG